MDKGTSSRSRCGKIEVSINYNNLVITVYNITMILLD